MNADPMEWIAVAALPGVGNLTFRRLLEAGWPPERLLAATATQWRQLGLKQPAREALQQYRQRRGPLPAAIDGVADWLARYGDARLLCLVDDDYPELLKTIPDPPPLLFVRGNLEALHAPQVAVVGSRSASRNGCDNAYRFAAELARSGLVITSGMAHGIDTAAHRATIELRRPTVAVFGTGPDRLYPARNRLLAQQILDGGGAWVSELLPGSPPLAPHFPRRNRIISGLSAGVLVVEAAPRSGSLITARQALEQGREVFAVPGALNNPMSQGCHALIREGAVLVESAAHIVEQLGALLGAYAVPDAPEPAPAPRSASQLEADEQALLAAMGFELITLDRLADVTGLAVPELSRLLVGLELKGCLEATGSGYLRLC